MPSAKRAQEHKEDLATNPFGYAPFDRLRAGRAGKAQNRQHRQAPDQFFVFRLTIAKIPYKYMHIYLWSTLRIVVFERWL